MMTIQTTRSKRQVLLYITKDLDPSNVACFNFDLDAYYASRVSKKKAMAVEIAKAVRDGMTMKDICLEFPGYALLHVTSISKYRDVVMEDSDEFVPFEPKVTASPSFHTGGSAVIDWLNNELGKRDRPIKSPNLWICGDSNTGKTTLVQTLAVSFPTYFMPYDGRWVEDYSNAVAIVVFEEFGGQYTTLFMRQFCDGSRVKLPRRGRSPFLKTRNTPIIVLSNETIEQVYHNIGYRSLLALKNRFVEIELEAGLGYISSINVESGGEGPTEGEARARTP